MSRLRASTVRPCPHLSNLDPQPYYEALGCRLLCRPCALRLLSPDLSVMA